MDFGDLASRLKKAREKEGGNKGDDRPFDFEESYRLRGKMLGVLIRDARVAASRTLEDCANILGVTPQDVENWEFGNSVPSLPQLELLAYYLDVPISHFWGQTTLQAEGKAVEAQDEYLKLRDRMIGALLRQAREGAGKSEEELAQAANLSVEQISAYELGETPIPMHHLTVLASHVGKNLNYFLESSSQLGELLAIREMWKHFTELPQPLREFAANPTNIGFIELAYMLSQMPADKLRKMGESMLDITM